MKQIYAKLILIIKQNIDYIKNGEDFIEKYNLTLEEIKAIQDLCIIPKEPEMLPVEQRTKEINGYFQGFVWNDIDKRFKCTGSNNPTNKQLSYCSVLTCLIRAINNKQTCADLLTRYTGKKYIKIEF